MCWRILCKVNKWPSHTSSAPHVNTVTTNLDIIWQPKFFDLIAKDLSACVIYNVHPGEREIFCSPIRKFLKTTRACFSGFGALTKFQQDSRLAYGLWSSQCLQIQGDRRRKDNILQCDSIGHFEKKVYMNICLILNGYRDKAVWVYRY